MSPGARDPGRTGRLPVTVGGRAPLSRAAIARAVRLVVAAESPRRRQGRAAGPRVRAVQVTFLTRPAMQRLNRQWKGHDRPTDVLAFPLVGPDGALLGDLYICPAVARRQAVEYGVTPREECCRLVVHGTLHILGYDHPEGPARTRSAMWRRQEGYVTRLA